MASVNTITIETLNQTSVIEVGVMGPQGPQGPSGSTSIATPTTPGSVKPDGVTTTVDADGTIHAAGASVSKSFVIAMGVAL